MFVLIKLKVLTLKLNTPLVFLAITPTSNMSGFVSNNKNNDPVETVARVAKKPEVLT